MDSDMLYFITFVVIAISIPLVIVIACLIWAKKQKKYYEEHPDIVKQFERAARERKLTENKNSNWADEVTPLLVLTFVIFVVGLVCYVINIMDWWKYVSYFIVFVVFLSIFLQIQNYFYKLGFAVNRLSSENEEILQLLRKVSDKLDNLYFEKNTKQDSSF